MNQDLGRLLVTAGLVLVAVGLVIWLGAKIPGSERLALGRLPGDLRIEHGNLRLYFPLTTSVLLSLALTLVVWLVRRWRG